MIDGLGPARTVICLQAAATLISTLLTYVDFLTQLRTLLDSAVASTEVRLSSSVVIGSDEEKGLTKALRDVFNDSTHMLCVKHLRDNMVDYMRNKCGVQQSVRNRLIAKMFDDGGLINADDSGCGSIGNGVRVRVSHTRAALPASRRARPPHVRFRGAPAASAGPSAVEQQRRRVRQPPAEAVNRVASTASAINSLTGCTRSSVYR